MPINFLARRGFENPIEFEKFPWARVIVDHVRIKEPFFWIFSEAFCSSLEVCRHGFKLKKPVFRRFRTRGCDQLPPNFKF